MNWLSIAFFTSGLGILGWFMVRPLWKTRPKFSDFYTGSESVWAAIRMKLNTIKTKLTAILVVIASLLIELHDFVLPAATGLDWTPVTAQIPPAVWPFVSIAIAGFFYWLRKVTANTHEVEIKAVVEGASPEEAAVIAEKEPA